MTSLTLEMVSAIMPNAISNGLEKEFSYLLDTCKRYDITTKNRVAAFLANVAKESGELYYTEEIADGWDYEGRADLGNVYSGDGPTYKGHGYIQITGRANHKVVGDALGVDAISDPLILTQMPYAWLSAGYYWRYMSSWGNLNDYADQEDFGSTVLGVRGGPDPDRWRYWYAAMEVLPDDLDLGDGVVADTQRDIDFDASGWAIDKESGVYLRSERTSATLHTNANGWLWGDKEVSRAAWEWPIAEEEADPNSYNYQARHPTRYFWRPDIEQVARRLVDNYDVWCNTYLEHPEGYGYNVASTDADGTVWYVQNTSVDVWGAQGRNDPIDYTLGNEIFGLLFNDPNPPNINWIIWQETIYGAWNGWNGEYFGDGSEFTAHRDHIHITYW